MLEGLCTLLNTIMSIAAASVSIVVVTIVLQTVTGGVKKKPGAVGAKGKKPASSDAAEKEEPMEKELTVCCSTANKHRVIIRC